MQHMPKLPSFAVVQTPKGWRVRVPKSISDTGKEQVRFFPARRKAAAFAKKLREEFRESGEGATVLPPRVADDALRAWAILEPLGISLTEAAKQVAREHDAIARSVPLSEAANAWLRAMELRGLRDITLRSYRGTLSRLQEKFGNTLLARIEAAGITEAISGASYALNRRNASAFWRWCASAPRKWCDAAVFEDVERVTVRNDRDIAVLSPTEVERLLRTAEKHFPETVATYAIALFGGVRMEELVKLTADAVTEDGIEIGATVAKKRRRRHLPMNRTLAAWLTAYPFEPCPNWPEKHKAVRALAGWQVATKLPVSPPSPTLGRWPKNAMRHTHASAEIANGATLEDLLFRFGHTGGAEMLRSHYVGRFTKREALAFWSIGPRGQRISTIAAA